MINDFFFNLKNLPAQFSKRFQGKMSLKDALLFAKKLKYGEEVKGIEEKTKNHLLETVSATTLNDKYIDLTNQFFDYAVACGKLEKNPLRGRKIKSKEEAGSFRSFTNEELEIIFSKSIFSEKEIEDNRYFKFWLPILGLYTGARVNEIAQLRIKDIKREKDIYYFDITDSEETSVKNSASRRKSVIHKDVLKIGFVNYTEWLKKNNEHWLFPEIKGSEIKGKPVSKWFSRFIKNECGIKNGKIEFYSFRNNMTDCFKQKSAAIQNNAAQLGHKMPGMSYEVYGSGIKLENMNENLLIYVDYSELKLPWNKQDFFEMKKFPWE